MSNWTHSLRMTALAATLLAGSCASDDKDGITLSPDGAANHPIMVEPSYMSLRLPFSAGEAGLLPEDAARFQGFVSDYLNDGNGAISISAPDGPDARAAITYFAERLAPMGVPRATYPGRHARRDEWRLRASSSISSPMRRAPKRAATGRTIWPSPRRTRPRRISAARCSTTSPRWSPIRAICSGLKVGAGGRDAPASVIDHYEKGDVTAATKSKDQTGAVSDVGTGGSGQSIGEADGQREGTSSVWRRAA